MSNVLILGAAGQIAKLAEEQLLAQTQNHLTLFLRKANRLAELQNDKRITIIDGDVTDHTALVKAMTDQDIVYANLGNNGIEKQAKSVVSAMNEVGLKRLIWISTLGIYDEVPGKYGEWNHKMLDGGYLETYTAAAKVIESSDLDYTIIRPAWLDNKDEIDFELTQKGEPFKGTEVSRKSITAVVVDLINDPAKAVRHSIGVNKPNTDGDKPAWY